MTQPDSPTPPPSSPATPPPAGAAGAPPIDYGTPPKGPPAYTGPAPDKDSITMGMLCHLLAIFTWFIGPLLIWLIKKDQSPFVDDQGKEALNFQIATLIASVICIPLNFVFCLGFLLLIAIHITRIVFCIIATIQANKGIAYRYPLNLRLIK